MLRIIIADDSLMLRQRLVSMLSEVAGVEVVGEVQGAAETLAAIRACHPDVLTLDIQMFGSNGLDVLRQIKREPGAPVVLLLTNQVSPPYRRTCLAAGADFFLDKATESMRVLEIVQQQIFRRLQMPAVALPQG
jgi:DNA-binding NarL/FixJ family response regulator